MRRRLLLAGAASLTVLPSGASAQSSDMAGGQFRVGVLVLGDPEPFWTIFRAALKDLGYSEGNNLKLELRSADFVSTRLDSLAADLVRLKVDAIVAVYTPPALAAKRATRTIPVVMAGVGDPVGTGLIVSQARPEANLTGVSAATAELAGKSVELLKEILPAARRIAALANSPDPFHKPFLEQISRAGASVGVEIQPVLIGHDLAIEAAFAGLISGGIEAVIVQPSLSVKLTSELALKHRLPAASPARQFAEAGGVLSYAADMQDVYRESAIYLDKILKGARPGDLPVQGPVQIELVINLRTARALGISIPQSILLRANEVVE